MNKKKKLWFLLDFVIVACLIALDQFTKWLAVTKLKGNPAFVLIDGVLEFDYLENRGVAFGMFQNKRIPILVCGIVFLAVILFLLFRLPEGKKYTVLHVILSCIIAGGIGNMIDRFLLGYVVDFISFVLINYPIFNVADCYVVCAAIGLCVCLLFVFKEDELDFLLPKKRQNKEK